MTDHTQKRFWSGIDIPKTLAGTLAALSAAVVGSFLGLAGTIIGAALASLISSIGTEVYHRSINQGKVRLQSAFVTAPAAVGTPEVAADHEAPSEQKVEQEAEPPVAKRPIAWKRVSLVAAAVFVVALGALTTIELMAGKTAADAVNGRDGGSPTLLNFSNDSRESDTTTPVAPQESQAPAEPGESTPATDPETTGPETTEPTSEPTATPTGEPTTPVTGEDPATDDPATGEDPATGGGTGTRPQEGQ